MTTLTRDMIARLQAEPHPPLIETVPCPEWGEGVTVAVRMMSSADAGVFERHMWKTNRLLLHALNTLAPSAMTQDVAGGLPDMSALSDEEAEVILQETPSHKITLVLQTACQDDGTLLFTRNDTVWLQAQPAPLIQRLYDAAWTLNGLGAEAVKDAEKNSVRTQTSASGSSFQSNGAGQPVS